MLTQMLDALDQIDGIVFYSLFQLPNNKVLRESIFDRVLSGKKSLHFAVETLFLVEADDRQRLEDIWGVSLEAQRLSVEKGPT